MSGYERFKEDERKRSEGHALKAHLKPAVPAFNDRPKPARMTEAQRDKLWDSCGRYGVPFREDDYHVFSPNSSMMASWVEGWVGGNTHATADRGGTDFPTIYLGVSPEGDSHS